MLRTLIIALTATFGLAGLPAMADPLTDTVAAEQAAVVEAAVATDALAVTTAERDALAAELATMQAQVAAAETLGDLVDADALATLREQVAEAEVAKANLDTEVTALETAAAAAAEAAEAASVAKTAAIDAALAEQFAAMRAQVEISVRHSLYEQEQAAALATAQTDLAAALTERNAAYAAMADNCSRNEGLQSCATQPYLAAIAWAAAQTEAMEVAAAE